LCLFLGSIGPARAMSIGVVSRRNRLSRGCPGDPDRQSLGYSSITLASNTYRHVLERRQRQVAARIDEVLGR